jgi:hypothetical protein
VVEGKRQGAESIDLALEHWRVLVGFAACQLEEVWTQGRLIRETYLQYLGINDIEEEHGLEQGVCELWFLSEKLACLIRLSRDESLAH